MAVGLLSTAVIMGMPLTAGDSLLRCQELNEMSLLLFDIAAPYVLDSLPANFAICAFHCIHHAGVLQNTLWNIVVGLIGIFCGFHNPTKLAEK